MRKITLGRTGLEATVAGLGTGGHSALGLKKFGQDHAASIVRAAYDEGINFFDTATKYGTESAVGQGLAGIPRESYILSSKFDFINKADRTLKTVQEFNDTLDNSLESFLSYPATKPAEEAAPLRRWFFSDAGNG